MRPFQSEYTPEDLYRLEVRTWVELDLADLGDVGPMTPQIAGWQIATAPLDAATCRSIHAAVSRLRKHSGSGAGHKVYAALLREVPGDTNYSFYIGLTGTSPEQRYRDHLAGIRSGRGWIRKYGIGLLPELYEWLNPMAYDRGIAMERELADALRTTGLDVHQA